MPDIPPAELRERKSIFESITDIENLSKGNLPSSGHQHDAQQKKDRRVETPAVLINLNRGTHYKKRAADLYS